MFVIQNRKIFYWISGVLIVLSLFAVTHWGLSLGIDFKGGSILEVEYPGTRPETTLIHDKIQGLKLGEFSMRPTGDKGYIVRARELSDPERQSLIQALTTDKTKAPEVKRFDSIGPILGKEAARKALLSIIIVIIGIVLFITYAFRTVSRPVSSWKYGIVTIIALLHDIIVPVGVFAFLGHFKGFEVDTLFVTALLVILGFSVHDTIVVFDRVRENLKHNRGGEFSHIVGSSISQTFTRSINTSLTVVLSLIVLYFLGSEATRNFSLALLVGIIAGTYSSIFIGSPLLVTLQKWQNRGK